MDECQPREGVEEGDRSNQAARERLNSTFVPTAYKGYAKHKQDGLTIGGHASLFTFQRKRLPAHIRRYERPPRDEKQIIGRTSKQLLVHVFAKKLDFHRKRLFVITSFSHD